MAAGTHENERFSRRIGVGVIEQTADYASLLEGIKSRIQSTQIRAALAVSHELVLLYHQIGQDILTAQAQHGWGDKVLERIALDLKAAFPGVEGFSRSNLYRMKAFVKAYPEFVPQPVGQIPWGHNAVLIEKIKDPNQRLWYAQKTIEHGWSRSILEMQIQTRAHERHGKATTNFERTLPPAQSDLAQQILKDPYNFDFLTLEADAQERHLERGLLEHLKAFLLEMGAGFAFLGSQYHLEVGGQDYYIDLLFYHVKLHCYVVIELKARAFKPEDAGQLSFYLAAIDGELRQATDNPTVGLLLCKTKNAVIAEYALRNINAPLGVSEYQITEALPKDLESSLPSVAQLEAELLRLENQEPA
jgi:predicted nuclease of restriction endonuclease-like (RecB) superfamily